MHWGFHFALYFILYLCFVQAALMMPFHSLHIYICSTKYQQMFLCWHSSKKSVFYPLRGLRQGWMGSWAP